MQIIRTRTLFTTLMQKPNQGEGAYPKFKHYTALGESSLNKTFWNMEARA